MILYFEIHFCRHILFTRRNDERHPFQDKFLYCQTVGPYSLAHLQDLRDWSAAVLCLYNAIKLRGVANEQSCRTQRTMKIKYK